MEGEKGKKVEVAEVVEEKRSRFRKICVFCGNQPGRKAIYQEAAIELGRELVTQSILLPFPKTTLNTLNNPKL